MRGKAVVHQLSHNWITRSYQRCTNPACGSLKTTGEGGRSGHKIGEIACPSCGDRFHGSETDAEFEAGVAFPAPEVCSSTSCQRCGAKHGGARGEQACRTAVLFEDIPDAVGDGIYLQSNDITNLEGTAFSPDLDWYFRVADSESGLRSAFGGQLAKVESGQTPAGTPRPQGAPTAQLSSTQQPHSKPDLEYTDRQIGAFRRSRRIYASLSRIAYAHQKLLASYYEDRRVAHAFPPAAVEAAHSAFFIMRRVMGSTEPAAPEFVVEDLDDPEFTVKELAEMAGVGVSYMKQLLADAKVGRRAAPNGPGRPPVVVRQSELDELRNN